jgi:hypothetical protein
MADINLSQAEANLLIAMEKHRVTDDRWEYPDLGGSVNIPLVSVDRRENFTLDLYRGRIDLAKGSYQSRSRQVIILIRLDFGGQPHRNPNGEEVASPHLHVFREGYGDKWAIPAPLEKFPLIDSDRWQTLIDFMVFCNVTKQPIVQKGLWS